MFVERFLRAPPPAPLWLELLARVVAFLLADPLLPAPPRDDAAARGLAPARLAVLRGARTAPPERELARLLAF
ncbi:MAG TPA: hypothetical protein VER33_02330, partial [Polyangiaceae bacterium]|nr:hypothetical protein [Polyangiaceae bacterium]